MSKRIAVTFSGCGVDFRFANVDLRSADPIGHRRLEIGKGGSRAR
jgi:hypothetical protein